MLKNFRLIVVILPFEGGKILLKIAADFIKFWSLFSGFLFFSYYLLVIGIKLMAGDNTELHLKRGQAGRILNYFLTAKAQYSGWKFV